MHFLKWNRSVWLGGSFFFTRIGSRPYQNSGFKSCFLFKMCFLLKNVLPFQKDVSFSRGSFFFTRIGSRPYQNSGKYKRVFLFHQNWFATIPKFREIQECFLFTMSCLFRSDVSFSIDVSFSKCVSFSIDVSFSKMCFRFKKVFPFQEDFFFTRIGSRPYQTSGTFETFWNTFWKGDTLAESF